MSQANNLPATMQPVEPPQMASARACVLFCVMFVLVQASLLAGSFWIASKPWFLRHDAYPRIVEQSGYSLRARNVNCEIVIYGDSTALVDLEPAVIQERTGLKTCNVAETVPVHWVVGSVYPLDQYLAHNTAPRFLLTMWSAASFHPVMAPMSAYFPEGLVYALQFHRGAYLWDGLRHHPEWAANFSIWVLRSMLTDLTDRLHLTKPRYSELEATPRDIRAGLWDIDQPPQTSCDPPQSDVSSQHEKEESIAAFRQHYNKPGTQVIVDVAPLAGCVRERDDLARSNQGLHDNRFELLPMDQFNLASTHLIRSATHRVSEEAAEQILDLMHDKNPTARP